MYGMLSILYIVHNILMRMRFKTGKVKFKVIYDNRCFCMSLLLPLLANPDLYIVHFDLVSI